jgi:mycothiol synthase
VTSPAATSDTARELAIPGLPADVRVRPFAYPADLPAMAELIAAVGRFDGHDWFPTPDVLAVYWRSTPMFDPNRDCLVLDDGAGMAAMVSVDPQVRDGKTIHWIEGWVRPDRRRQGIGRALLGWAERHAVELVATREIEHADLPQFAGLGVLESNPAAIAFAHWTGYARIRYGFVMRRELAEPLPDIALPDGIELRPVRPEHHRPIWDADVEAFRDHFEPRDRDETDFVAAFTAPNVETGLWCVAWDGDQVVGSVMNQIDPEENARIGLEIGWLEHVSVRRAWRGRGVASALIAMSLRALRDRGMAIAALGVDGENPTGALRLYEGLGFRRHETWITYRRPLTDVAGRGLDR